MTTEREAMEAAIEGEIVRRLAMESPDKAAGMLTTLAATCPPPLSRWFADQRWSILALAWGAVLRGECAADPMAWAEYLDRIPQGIALDLTAGRKVRPWEPCASGVDSALARIGGVSAIISAPDDGIVASWPSLVQRLCHAGQARMAVDALREVAKQVRAASFDDGPAAALAVGMDRIAAVLGGGGSAGCLGDALAAALDHAEEAAALRARGGAPAASWGIPGLDDLVPMKPGGLYVLAASPGGGKTSMALQATLATAETGRPGAVGYVSEEMPAGDLAVIMAARSLGLSRKAIETRDARLRAEDWDRLRALVEGWRTRGTVSILDAGTAAKSTTGRAVAWIRQRSQVAAGNLALIVVDHLGLLESDNPRATEYDRVSDTTRALKRAAVQAHVPILALCQMNRAGRKEIRDRSGKVAANPEPVLSDLRGSGSIEQDADAVVMLHKPEVEPDAKRVPVVAYVRKNRSGPLGSVPLIFRPAFQAFEPCHTNP